jgi:hypothetical protein
MSSIFLTVNYPKKDEFWIKTKIQEKRAAVANPPCSKVSLDGSQIV